MAYVITQNCCKDASCVPVCPVDCIRPTSSHGQFRGSEMLFIDPESCIDCGACMDECPVGAIYYDDDLPDSLQRYRDINAAYFERHPLVRDATPAAKPHAPVTAGSLRVAVIGTGPAACYAAEALLAVEGVEVNMFERLPTPFGLIRAGVAPDHQRTKSIVNLFTSVFTHQRLGCYLNVEIGSTLSHAEVLDFHHAVVYATGATSGRELGIAGEQMLGSHSATDAVGWYNGHPDHTAHVFDFSSQRAVIVGNGNVALDMARMLLLPAADLAGTDIAAHALEALSNSAVEEVVILGRRGPRAAAFSVGEFLALGDLPGLDVIIDGVDASELEPSPDDALETSIKIEIVRDYFRREPTPGNKRIIFQFNSTPVSFEGDNAVTGLRVRRADRDEIEEVITSSLVLRSIGYRGGPIPGLPFDPVRHIIPNDAGRVTDERGRTVAGVYVTGWIKRGPHGIIGTNRVCAEETIAALFADFDEGRLTRSVAASDTLQQALSERDAVFVDWNGWRAIDTAERERGAAQSRPRIKFVAITELLDVARAVKSDT